MTYSAAAIAAFFDAYGDAEWQRFDTSALGAIQLHVHRHYLALLVPRGARVLEIGAGPGRFTAQLHSLGCRVVVADISPVQLALNERYGAELGFNECVEDRAVLDIADLAVLADASFDAVVAYGGPLSYVFEQREVALAGCRRVLRDGGLLLASVMSLWGTIHRHLPVMRDLPIENTRRIISHGDLTLETEPGSKHFCHMYRAHDLTSLFARHGFVIAALSASNALSTNMEPLLQELRGMPERWDALLAFEIEAAAQPGFVDGGTHLIVAGHKI